MAALAAALATLVACSGPQDGNAAGEVGGEPEAPSGFFEGTSDEWMALRATCIEEAGWEVEVDEVQGRVSVPGVRPDQWEAFQRVLDDCDARHGVLPPGDPVTEEQIRSLYPLTVAARECLVAEGYEVSEPPSEDWFVEHYPEWYPYDEIDAGMDWDRVNEVCPQPRLVDE